MHILFIPSWYPNKKSPFDGNFIQNKAKAVSQYAKVSVLFCTSHNENGEYITEISESGSLKEVIIYFPFHSFFLVRIFRKLLAYRIGMKQISFYNIIHCFVFYYAGVLATLLAVFQNKPIFYTEHSSFFQNYGFVKRSIFKLLSKKFSGLLLESRDLCLTAKNYGIPPTKIQLIPTTIDANHFQIAQRDPLPYFKFLHISKFEDPRKNVKGILYAIKKLSQEYDNFKIEFGGDGDISVVKHWAEEIVIPENFLIFSNAYTYQDLPQVYASADCFIFFSRFENFGMVLAESILCGVPVIATNVGGIPDFVNDKNGILIESEDTEALYIAMKTFILKKTNFTPEVVRTSLSHYVRFEAIGKAHWEKYNEVL